MEDEKEYTYEYHATGRVTVTSTTPDEAWSAAREFALDQICRLDYEDFYLEEVK